MNSNAPTIRAAIKAERLALHAIDQEIAAVMIADKLLRMTSLQRAKNIGVYMAFRGEVDTTYFTECAKLRKKRIFLPVLRNSELIFAPHENPGKMRPNRFGILEPVYKKSALLKPMQLDVVITPLVAFDASCNRLGMGGGYYDRCFAFRKHRTKWRKPRLIGVAYDFQRAAELHPESWDVPLDAVVTEQQIYGSD